jgi:hypothetical protein
MSDTSEKLEALLAAAEDKKKAVIAAAMIAKADFLNALDGLEDKYEDIDKDALKMKLLLAKLKVLEEWDEIEEKLEGFGDKAQEIAKYSEEEAKKSWNATKELTGDIEKRIKKFLS